MLEQIAEIMWRSEYRRATGRERSIRWAEVADKDKDRYRYTARDIEAFVSQQTRKEP